MIWIIIPAYNESSTIREVIRDLKSNGYTNIIIVDDGSKDNTYEIARKEKVVVLKHVINRGQGAALKTGIDYSLSKGADIIITFDSDGQHLAEDIRWLIEPIVKGEADIVLGSRFLNKRSNAPFIRKLFLKGGARIFRTFYGVRLTDSHNGLRALSRKAAKSIRIRSDGMEHASEIVEEVAKHNLRYIEVPVTIKYTDYSLEHGQSTFNGFKILYKMLVRSFLR